MSKIGNASQRYPCDLAGPQCRGSKPLSSSASCTARQRVVARSCANARLEAVLDESPDLTPGDFVRSVKQLIDLLDQIASVPQTTPAPAADVAPVTSTTPASPGMAATARATIDAMRRGVVAYSTVTG